MSMRRPCTTFADVRNTHAKQRRWLRPYGKQRQAAEHADAATLNLHRTVRAHYTRRKCGLWPKWCGYADGGERKPQQYDDHDHEETLDRDHTSWPSLGWY